MAKQPTRKLWRCAYPCDHPHLGKNDTSHY